MKLRFFLYFFKHFIPTNYKISKKILLFDISRMKKFKFANCVFPYIRFKKCSIKTLVTANTKSLMTSFLTFDTFC